MLVFVTAGLVLGLSAGFSPGPLMALVIAQSLRHGSREGIKVALVPLLTDLPIIGLSIFAVSRIAEFRTILGAISVAGGLFVAYLAVGSLRAERIDLAHIPVAPRSLSKGSLVNLLSPHPWLFWLTVGSPLMMKAWKESWLSALLFLGAFYSCLVGAKIFLALMAGRSKELLAGKMYTWLMRALGILLFVFAVLLVRDGLTFLVVSISS